MEGMKMVSFGLLFYETEDLSRFIGKHKKKKEERGKKKRKKGKIDHEVTVVIAMNGMEVVCGRDVAPYILGVRRLKLILILKNGASVKCFLLKIE
tara:strand:+ start:6 stop:290 length:285 start_codon:yes stop_codon:yes gene_type:complete